MDIKEVETKEEIFNLPCYFTEDGKKRYMEILKYDMMHYNIYDEFGRIIKVYFFGDWWKYFYDDKRHRVTIIRLDAINCSKTKYVRDFRKSDYPYYDFPEKFAI